MGTEQPADAMVRYATNQPSQPLRRAYSVRGGGGYSVNDAEQRRMEAWKVHFDFLKHVTTLDTASALIVVTIYKELDASLIVTASALVFFGVALLIAVLGMVAANRQIRLAPTEPSRKPVPSRFYRVAPASLFLSGLWVFVYGYVLFTLISDFGGA
jgi:hypothetical protein